MSAPSPIPYRLGQRRAQVARARLRLRREARARARRMPVYPESRIEQQLDRAPGIWQSASGALWGIGLLVVVELAFALLGIAAYHAFRWLA